MASLALVLGVAAARVAPRVWLVLNLVGTAAGLVGAATSLSAGLDWEWRGGLAIGGEEVHLRLDALSGLFLAILSLVGGVGALYGREYWTDADHPRSAGRGRAWWSLVLLGMGAVLLSANGLHFLLAWELFALGVFFLVTLDGRRAEVRSAGWLYLVASHAATLCLFAFFAALAARTGSWELGPMQDRSDLAPLFWLALLGFGIKAGLFPLHVWLPVTHANAPSHVSALMSGVAIKMGIYGLFRFSGWMPLPDGAGWAVATLGVVSAVLGVAFALAQHDLKRLLAYHSVENVGIIAIGLGFAMLASSSGQPAWGMLALAGGLLHVWNHGLFKSLLFLGAGSVLHATGQREMNRMGGLWRSMPLTAGLFGLGAAAISALPPLNGMVSEWLVFLGLFDAATARAAAAPAAIAAAVLLGVTGALALACFVKVCGVVFLGAPRSRGAARAHECGPAMRGSMLVLAAACVAIGLGPALCWPAIARAAAAWLPAWAGADTPPPLRALGVAHVALALAGLAAATLLWQRVRRHGLSRAPTWDCGYAQPSARMQYTAGSFAATITEWFALVLRPRRHEQPPEGIHPLGAHHEEHPRETVLEDVVVPAGRAVLGLSCSVRRLQHGRVQSYVFYLLVGLAAVAALVVVRTGR